MQSDLGRVCSDRLQEAFFGTRRTVGHDRDPAELDHLAATLETCSKYGIRSQAECITYIRATEGRLEHKYGGSASDQKPLDLLREAHAYITEHNPAVEDSGTCGNGCKARQRQIRPRENDSFSAEEAPSRAYAR